MKHYPFVHISLRLYQVSAALTFLLLVSPPQVYGQNLVLEGEGFFGRMQQLTFGGQNAEGYFSFDESRLIFQSTRDTLQCDQQFTLDLSSMEVSLVSTGKGRTTCGYFLPGDRSILFASTHARISDCPPRPDYSKGYVWPVYSEFDIYRADANGKNLVPLITSDGYDAEATVSPNGERIIFTSTRNGDLDLFSSNLEGTDIIQLTDEIGYDGGAFYSWDGAKIVYRSWHHETEADITEYQALLGQDLVRPSRMEIFVMNADGSGKRQVTNNGAANFAPFFHPDNNRIIFASNMADPRGRNFDIYLMDADGTGLKRVTTNETFDGFPMFTRDGKKLVFASNRNGSVRGETNLFIVEWNE